MSQDMDTRASNGFTIIETMLFLAVSAALLVGVLLTIGATINTQRYRDAADSFKALVQQQYSDINNTQNGERTTTYTCNTQGRVIATSTVADIEARGQSKCVSVGKYMVINQGTVRIYPVIAYEVPGAAETDNDITSLTTNYRLNVTSVGMITDELRWGTSIAFATNGAFADGETGNRSTAILFVRSPKTGQVYTFTRNSYLSDSVIASGTNAPTVLREMIVAGETVPGQRYRTICIDSKDLLATGLAGKLALYIPSYASGPSAIELRSNETLKVEAAKAKRTAEQCN